MTGTDADGGDADADASPPDRPVSRAGDRSPAGDDPVRANPPDNECAPAADTDAVVDSGVPVDSGGTTDPDAVVDADSPAELDPEAFQALGNEDRLAVLRHLLDRDDAGRPVASFSELQDAVGADSSAGFAYHLRQLTGRYVRKVRVEDSDAGDSAGDGDPEEGYVLTYAGRKVARAVAAGTYTDSVDLPPVELADPCPHCGREELLARCADNVVGVACGACDRPVLSLPFPPRGYRDRPPEAIPEAFDRYHRHRLSLLREGVCPECAGQVTAGVDRPFRDDPGDPRDRNRQGGPDDRAGSPTGPDPEGTRNAAGAETNADVVDRPADRLQVAFECTACGHGARSPVTLSLLSHPAVVAFYRDHGVDLRDRPLWNVGDEWRENLLSEDPWAVVVSTELDGEVLELFVDRSAAVVDHRRRSPGE